MGNFALQTFEVVLTALMGYIVWLLKEQKKERIKNCDIKVQKEAAH